MINHSLKNNRLGSVTNIQTTSSSLTAETTHGRFKIVAFSDQVIQVTASRESSFEDFSYTVQAAPQNFSVEINDTPDQIELTTPALRVHIEKNPVRITFKTAEGKIINEDDPLGINWIGEQVTNYKKLQLGERFLGLGEKTGSLDRKGQAYTNWNTDAYAYHSGADPLYSSIPFYIGVHNGLCYGIFFDNSYKSFFNFGASNNRFASFSADAGELNYYFIYGQSVGEVIQHYTWLTGRMELPPLWSIGYQQCRYSYYPDKEVLSVARTFREKNIPADAIVLDIHYMDKYKIFTWDPKNFPDPKKMIDTVKHAGFHIVIMCDPGIKIESGYEPYDDGVKKNVFLKYPDGENYSGQVWPGWCHFPDFTNPATRNWWAEKFKDYVALGVEGFWNDMNEIATWGHGLPENIEFDFEGNKGTMRRGRNLYGFQMARSTYEGTKKLLNGKRPFNLTRSGFAGVQRYAAVWTGDNVSYDEHMLLGVRIVNSLGLSGVAFAGYDTGGFVGDANTKLFARWISTAAFSPFFRAHTMINTRDSEPWSYGEEVEQISRNFIRLRYQLMPYLYSLFFDAAQRGMPVQRALAIDYSDDPKIFDGQYQNQYLFGPGILVAPVESTKELTKVYLPAGNWYYLYTGQMYAGNQEIMIECPIHRLPVFVKAGALLPLQPAVMHTGEKTQELIVHFYYGKQSSEFLWYADDGETYAYQQGNYSQRLMAFHANEKKLTISKREGTYNTGKQEIRFVLHGFAPDHILVNGQTAKLSAESMSFFTPLEKYDPINDPDSMGEEPVKSFSIPYTEEAIELHWQ
ncbi:MAG: glycoside hydrolase family 31 protein [Bacteroidetes bacterium]|nr:glycoside hydrolase family 31 protein [Bacteroidota bacterium]MBS1541465.1 glycoside hydrolase family 31 protein [Bacteroidota bacterium]